MNLLPLANVVAAGFDWDYLWHWTHNDGLVKAVIGAVIAGIVSLSVAWWNGRKVDKQMELSKEATPPELTRYKEWIEISEKYKELVNSNNVDKLSKKSKEYKGIKASRKLAFEIAVWERKVLAACPNIQAQKRMVQIPASKINEISNPDVSNDIYLRIDSYFRPLVSELLWIIVPLIYFSPLILISGFSGEMIIFSSILYIVVWPTFYSIVPNRNNGTLEANFYTRKMRVEFLEEKCKLQSVDYNPRSLRTHDYWEKWCMKEALRYSIIFDEWEDYVHCPWVDKIWYKKIWHKFWRYFCPGHYVRRSLKGKTEVSWGSYKDDKLNGDLKEKIESKKKLGRKGTQVPNSDTPEESQPTHPQG